MRAYAHVAASYDDVPSMPCGMAITPSRDDARSAQRTSRHVKEIACARKERVAAAERTQQVCARAVVRSYTSREARVRLSPCAVRRRTTTQRCLMIYAPRLCAEPRRAYYFIRHAFTRCLIFLIYHFAIFDYFISFASDFLFMPIIDACYLPTLPSPPSMPVYLLFCPPRVLSRRAVSTCKMPADARFSATY